MYHTCVVAIDNDNERRPKIIGTKKTDHTYFRRHLTTRCKDKNKKKHDKNEIFVVGRRE